MSSGFLLHPAEPWAFNNRGLAKLKLGRHQDARADFEAALRIEPEFEPARRNLESLSGDPRGF